MYDKQQEGAKAKWEDKWDTEPLRINKEQKRGIGGKNKIKKINSREIDAD